VGDTKADVMKI